MQLIPRKLTSGIYPVIRKLASTVGNSALLMIFFLSANTMYVAAMKNLTKTKSHRLAISAWVSNNVEGSYKRSVSLAMTISLCVTRSAVGIMTEHPKLCSGNINGAVSSNIVCL